MTTPQDDWANRIKYHQPNVDGVNAISAMRNSAFQWGLDVLAMVPAGREQALALTKMEEALMWAVKGIARHPSHQAQP